MECWRGGIDCSRAADAERDFAVLRFEGVGARNGAAKADSRMKRHCWRACDEIWQWLDASRIGSKHFAAIRASANRARNSPYTARSAAWSAQEQRNVGGAEGDVSRQHWRKGIAPTSSGFGRIFIVCATGKSGAGNPGDTAATLAK